MNNQNVYNSTQFRFDKYIYLQDFEIHVACYPNIVSLVTSTNPMSPFLGVNLNRVKKVSWSMEEDVSTTIMMGGKQIMCCNLELHQCVSFTVFHTMYNKSGAEDYYGLNILIYNNSTIPLDTICINQYNIIDLINWDMLQSNHSGISPGPLLHLAVVFIITLWCDQYTCCGYDQILLVLLLSLWEMDVQKSGTATKCKNRRRVIVERVICFQTQGIFN